MKFGGGLTRSAPTPAKPKSNACAAVRAARGTQAEGFPGTETAKACGLFSKWEDLISNHTCMHILAFKGELQHRLHRRAPTTWVISKPRVYVYIRCIGSTGDTQSVDKT